MFQYRYMCEARPDLGNVQCCLNPLAKSKENALGNNKKGKQGKGENTL